MATSKQARETHERALLAIDLRAESGSATHARVFQLSESYAISNTCNTIIASFARLGKGKKFSRLK